MHLLSTSALSHCRRAAGALTLALLALSAQAQNKSLTIGYQEIVIPMKLMIESNTLEAKTGYAVKWRKYDTGGDVAQALAAGEIQIGELGSSPLTNAIGNGAKLDLFWISAVIVDAEALVVRKGSGIRSWSDLAGKKVAVPKLSTAHFQLFARMASTGLGGRSGIDVVFMTPAQLREAWDQNTIDAAFVWDPVLNHIKGKGDVLATAGDIAKKGFPTFDAMAIDQRWGQANEAFVVEFVKELMRVNKLYRDNLSAWTASTPEVQTIAKHAAAKPEQVLSAMAQYQFLTTEQQLSSRWLGGGAAGTMTDTSLFVTIMTLGKPSPVNFRDFVSADYLKKAAVAVR